LPVARTVDLDCAINLKAIYEIKLPMLAANITPIQLPPATVFLINQVEGITEPIWQGLNIEDLRQLTALAIHILKGTESHPTTAFSCGTQSAFT